MKIESVQNRKIKELAKLHQKKERDRTGLFLTEGMHCLEEAAKAGILLEIYTSEEPEGLLFGLEPVECSPHVLEKLSEQKSRARWIGVCRKPDLQTARRQNLLILNEVQDPGNVGTLIRCAVAFGMDEVILSRGCADPYGPKTVQSSQGAVFQIPCRQENIMEFIETHPEIQFSATALHASSIPLRNAVFRRPAALILGNEGQGLPEDILQACDQTITIEMADFESLNVASAGSICMYQMYLQNH